MSDEDLASIIVYIRTLPPVRHELPRTEVPFPPGPLLNSLPRPLTEPVPPPDLSSPERRGRYLVELAACTDCHSPMDPQGQRIAGLEFAGGFPLQDATGKATSSNMTPDVTGIPYYTEELFVEALRTGHVKARKLHDIMPWVAYREMTDEDLKAIFAFVRTLPAVRHSVDNAVPPTPCRLCGYEHGNGERN
jgi:hypothetical protein